MPAFPLDCLVTHLRYPNQVARTGPALDDVECAYVQVRWQMPGTTNIDNYVTWEYRKCLSLVDPRAQAPL